ncbi:MAG TPA: hypothetical protein DCR55_13775 [Lentisphaeria bacterium]|nr:hypothetical protein [Lentisphaeria bacterium]
MSGNQARIEWFSAAGHFLCHFYMQAFPTLALYIPLAYGIERTAALNLNFAMAFLFGFGALPSGLIGDRWQGRGMLLISFLGMGACSLACAACTTPGQLTVALAGIGLFASIYHPIGMGLISKCCPNRGQSLGRNGVAGSLGIGAAPLLVGQLMAAGFSVPKAFATLAIPSLAVGVALLFVRIDETPLTAKTAAPQRRGDRTGFLIMLACMTLLGIAYRASTQVLPTHFEAQIGMVPWLAKSAKESATILAACVLLMAMVGQLIGGRAADRHDLRKAYVVFHLLSIPMVLLMASQTGLSLAGIAILYYTLSLGMQPIENSIVARITPDRLRATGFGIKFFCCFGLGAVGVALAQHMADEYSVERLYSVVGSLIILVMCIFSAFWWRCRKESFTNHG